MLDIGQDGTGLAANARFARDAAALMLQYYQNDYSPIAGNNYYNLTSNSATDLYNGNISCLSTDYYTTTPLLKSFRYDKLNRIKRMQTAVISAGEWGSLTDNFSTEYRYDYNGNILSLQRKDANAQIMHHINYAYNAKNNRLQAITATGINSSNYSYDAIGNLANDSGENIQVSWNAMNKVKQVNLPNNRQLQFSYSPTGQRQIKRSADKTEYYLHDATGNIMCIYELSGKYLTVKERTIYGSKRIGVYRQRIQLSAYTGFGQAVLLPGSGLVNVLHPSPIISPDGRHYLEGCNRLQVIGVAKTTLSVNTLAYKKGTIELKGLSPLMATRPTFLDGAKTAGLRDYELTDHLSNVMAVISDRKLSVDVNSDTITDYYAPQVVSFTDYYPFGFPMAERSGNLSEYRFGFNGQESDNEVYGAKTTYAFEYRMQDTRLGRFWSVDPLAGDYPWNSTYAFAENRVVDGMELEGLEYYYAADGTLLWKHGTSTQVMRVNAEFVEKNKGKTVVLKDLNANSTDVGMTNEELNIRAMLYTIRNTEAWGNKTLDYDDQFGGGKFGEGQTDQEKYEDHPRKAVAKWGKTSTASGAYMIRSGTWDWIKGKIGAKDFSPKNQDKGAVWLIKYRGALDLVKNGKIKEAFAKLKNEWTSLPGAKEEGMKQDDAMKTFKEGVAKELNSNSVIKTPKGELLTK